MRWREPSAAGPVLDVVAVLPLYVAFGVLKRLIALQRLARWAWRPGVTPADDVAARRAVQAVTRISHRLGSRDRDCLQRSLVLYRALSAAGVGPRLVLGFRQDGEAVRGHAWVEAGGAGRSVLPEDVSGYVEAMSFGAGGALSRTVAMSPDGATSAPAART